MCTSMKWVKTPYINHSILVPCGHCPSCQQMKANKRKARITNNVGRGDITLFVTLTYDNDFVPFVKRSDFIGMSAYYCDNSCDTGFYLPVYRKASGRFNRVGSGYDFKFVKTNKEYVVDKIHFSREDFEKGFNDLYDIKKLPGCVSVILYKDLQNFFKRLYVNLSRKYGYSGMFSSFKCAEYGPTTRRAHFHLLFTIRPEAETLFRHAIIEAWPFADCRRTAKFIEVAVDASSYVSSYVNRGSDFPDFLAHSAFRPRHSYSKGYGMANDYFSLDSLQKKIAERDMRYPVFTLAKGKFFERNILIPKYVVRRFFPKFKGYSRLPIFEILHILESPQRIAKYSRLLDLNKDDIHRIKVSLHNSYIRFLNSCGYSDSIISRHKYAVTFVEAWKCRDMTILRQWYDNEFNEPRLLSYDNWMEYKVHYVSPINVRYVESLLNENPSLEKYDNPNTFPRNVAVTNAYTDLFYKKLKTRKVNNISMSSLGYNV